jgi:tetratricopeptide (TPR) repeat protein
MKFLRFGCLAALVLLAAHAFAQRGGRVPQGGGEIQVRLVTPDNHPLTRMVQVELLQGGGGFVIEQVRSNSDGTATLAMPTGGGGSFRLRIRGMGIEETTSDLFTIDAMDASHFEIVKVKVTDPDVGVTMPGGVASANDLAVPAKARKEFEAGGASLHTADWKGAETHFETAIKQYPKFDRAYYGLGLAKQNDGDVPGAKEAFTKAVEINDKNADALRDLGRMDEDAQQWADAEGLLTKSVAVDPSSAAAFTLLAMAQIQQHKVDEAIASASRVHALSHKSYAIAHLILAMAYESKSQKDQAIAEYKLFIEEDPNGPRTEGAKQELAKLQGS